MLDNRTPTEQSSRSRPTPRHLAEVSLAVVVAMVLAGSLVLLTGGSTTVLLVGAVSGAALGIVAGLLVLVVLRRGSRS